MAERLKRCKCSVPGHGTNCVLADERADDIKDRSKKLRRTQDREEVREGRRDEGTNQ